ncbi:MAG: NFACT family protein, partial [Candidatus Latescibacteria bacterium]|nr:NFACT family protein [Candidatus Latescibacterota bacterium]
MAFDYITIKNLVEEFRSEILGTQVKESLQTEEHSLLLRFDEGHHLTICCSPHLPAIFLSPPPVSSPNHRLWQSNYLTGSVVQNIEQMGTDRIIHFQLEKQSRIGTARRALLIVELIGRNSNIILVDKDNGLIIDTLRRVTHQMNRFRQILPKVTYLAPPPQTRLNPQTGSLTEFKEMICSHPDHTVVHALVGTIVGMSMLTAREVAFRSGVDWEEKSISLNREKLLELWENIRSLYRQSSGEKAFILFDEKKSPVDFCIFNPSWVLAEQKLQVSSLNKAVEYFWSQRSQAQRRNQLRLSISTRLSKTLVSCRNKLEQLKRELAEAENAESLRTKGELLMASIGQIEKGQTEVKLSDFYDPQGQEVSIVLDPKLSPIENARQYFRRYRKLRKGKTITAERLAQERKRAEELEDYCKQAETLTDYADLLGLKDELAQKGYLKIEIPSKKRDKE